MKLKSLVVTLLILAAATPATRAEITPEKRTEIQRMLQLTGMERLMEQMKSQMIAALRQGGGNVPPEFWERLAAKMDVKDLEEQFFPIYDKYYSLEDLRAVNTFYETPAGQRVLASMPEVMREAMQAGQEWGRKMSAQAAADLAAERQSSTAAPAAAH